MSFAKNMGKINSRYVSKNFSGKYSQKILDYAKQYATDLVESILKRANQKTADAIRDLIGNKIANKVKKVSKNSKQFCKIIIAYGYFKDLTKIKFSDKLFRDKAFNIAKNPKYDGYQLGLASMA